MRDLVPDGVGFDLGLKFSYPKKKKIPFECLFGKKFLKVREFFGGKKFNMFILKIYVIDFKYFFSFSFSFYFFKLHGILNNTCHDLIGLISIGNSN